MRWTLALAAAALTPMLAGCADGTVTGGETPLTMPNSAQYLDGISSQPTVTEAKAFEGILLMLGRNDKVTFGEAIKQLTGLKILPAEWGYQADRPITRGKVAYMICQACDIKGGVTLALTGPSRRYCLRELQYRGMMASGPPYNSVTGMEYVAILTRADELRQTGKISPVMIQESISP